MPLRDEVGHPSFARQPATFTARGYVMGTATITLPSGLTGEIRNMKAKELSILADPQNGKAPKPRMPGSKRPTAKKAHPLDPVYAGCWLKTLDAGPYGFSVGDPVPWPKIVLADRFVALLHIRQLTYGNFEFRVRCPNGGCDRSKKPFVWEIDLTELEVKPLPDETIARIKAAGGASGLHNLRFPIEIDGTSCTFELLTGEAEANRPELSDNVPTHKKMLAQVASRLVTIDGVEVDPESDKVLDWVGNLDAPVLFQASRGMEAVDGGAETRTLITCPDCESEFPYDVPFGDPGFLTPTPK